MLVKREMRMRSLPSSRKTDFLYQCIPSTLFCSPTSPYSLNPTLITEFPRQSSESLHTTRFPAKILFKRSSLSLMYFPQNKMPSTAQNGNNIVLLLLILHKIKCYWQEIGIFIRYTTLRILFFKKAKLTSIYIWISVSLPNVFQEYAFTSSLLTTLELNKLWEPNTVFMKLLEISWKRHPLPEYSSYPKFIRNIYWTTKNHEIFWILELGVDNFAINLSGVLPRIIMAHHIWWITQVPTSKSYTWNFSLNDRVIIRRGKD